MNITYKELGLKFNHLYEILATTYFQNSKEGKIVPNTACMGIRLISDTIIEIMPYPDTTTFKNLQETRYIAINFVDDIYLYAIAALKALGSDLHFKKFPTKYYSYYEIQKDLNEPFKKELKSSSILIPYINKAWALILCKVLDENQIIKKDGLGQIKLTKFNLKVISFNKYKESFKLFNRTENLVLEIILLATRLKIAKEKGNYPLFDKIHERLINNKEDVERFGKNERAIKALDIVNDYINKLMN
ncbi:MAG: DUF447 domain-containing protein [Promethearchaeota archaeon]